MIGGDALEAAYALTTQRRLRLENLYQCPRCGVPGKLVDEEEERAEIEKYERWSAAAWLGDALIAFSVLCLFLVLAALYYSSRYGI